MWVLSTGNRLLHSVGCVKKGKTLYELKAGERASAALCVFEQNRVVFCSFLWFQDCAMLCSSCGSKTVQGGKGKEKKHPEIALRSSSYGFFVDPPSSFPPSSRSRCKLREKWPINQLHHMSFMSVCKLEEDTTAMVRVRNRQCSKEQGSEDRRKKHGLYALACLH